MFDIKSFQHLFVLRRTRNEDWMNSPYGSFDHLNHSSWYDGGWENTPPSDGDYTFERDPYSNFEGSFAQLPIGVQAPSSWPSTDSTAIMTSTEQYDFTQGQQAWHVTDVQTGRATQPPGPSLALGRRDARLMCIPQNGAIAAPTPPLDSMSSTAGDPCTYPWSTASDQLSVAPQTLQELFPSPSLPRKHPSTLYDKKGQLLFQQQKPRFAGDIYTALWVRGEGVLREGWCGFCPTWHKLKDSGYWYHMHYSHGIACSSGCPLDPPSDLRGNRATNVMETLCPTCEEWVSIGKVKIQTAYWRHAYKCLPKGTVKSPSRSPKKAAAVPSL